MECTWWLKGLSDMYCTVLYCVWSELYWVTNVFILTCTVLCSSLDCTRYHWERRWNVEKKSWYRKLYGKKFKNLFIWCSYNVKYFYRLQIRITKIGIQYWKKRAKTKIVSSLTSSRITEKASPLPTRYFYQFTWSQRGHFCLTAGSSYGVKQEWYPGSS